MTTLMVLIQIHGIVLVLLNHTCTRGLSVARMRDFHRIVYYELPGASGSDNEKKKSLLKYINIWEKIYRQNSDKILVINLYFMVFDCCPL